MMKMARKLPNKPAFNLVSIADIASWYCALVLVALVLLSTLKEATPITDGSDSSRYEVASGVPILDRPCEEVYVVQEGETLHTISDKCGDPFIVEQNPHIHDPDDVFPGLVIKITPSKA